MKPPTDAQLSRAAQTIEAKQITFAEYQEAITAAQRGETCEIADMPRINACGLAVYRCLRNLRPWTLDELAAATGYTSQSCSARWREIRRYIEKAGKGRGYREAVAGSPGLFTYRIELSRYPGQA